jgi:hypothetical protein
LDKLDMMRVYGWSSLAMAKRYTASRAEAKAIQAKRRPSPGDGLRV